jgi:hypothetical protein
MQIYVDTDSGTWGVAEKNLVILEIDNETLDLLSSGFMSDSEIINFGLSNRHSQ